MRISVVINTYNRATSLAQTLLGLRYQTHDAFEVVVVNGPSTDQTESVLAKFAGMVRVGKCPEVHLSKSRNIGIELAAGEVVAFIDDDAIPEPTWLEQLATAYDSERVGGAGGVVYDHTGFRLQYRHNAFTRLAHEVHLKGPADDYARPRANPFLGLMGTNSSFRRRCLEEINGFDEEIEYYLDETEVCMQVLDHGYTIRALPGAAVHHKYLSSRLRNLQRIVLDPYPLAKNRGYFTLRHAIPFYAAGVVEQALDEFVAYLRTYCEDHFAKGKMTAEQRRFFLMRLEDGLRDGKQRGREGARRGREIAPADPRAFLPFPVLRPAGGRLRIALIAAQDVALEDGAEDREAASLAALGHEVHLIARSPDNNRVDFENGVWVHRLAVPQRYVPDLEWTDFASSLCSAVAAYREACRIEAGKPLDLVSAPVGCHAALICALDKERFPTVLLPAASAALPTTPGPAGVLERAMVQRAAHIYPVNPSASEWRPTVADLVSFYRSAAAQHTQHLGTFSQTSKAVRRRLTKLLKQMPGMRREAARRTAARLLDPSCYPIDYLAVLRDLWHQPDPVFVSELYRCFLNREADAEGKAYHVKCLEEGMPRVKVVRNMALSEEAQWLDLPMAWLDALEPSPFAGNGARALWNAPESERLPLHRRLPRSVWRLLKRIGRAVLKRATRFARSASHKPPEVGQRKAA